MSGRCIDLRKTLETPIDPGWQRPWVTHRGHATDREPGCGPNQIGIRPPHPPRQRQRVTERLGIAAPIACNQGHNRLLADNKNQRFHDRPQGDAESISGFLRRARGFSEGANFGLRAGLGKSALDSLNGGVIEWRWHAD